MNGYELPVTLEVGGEMRPIRTDYRAVLDVLAAMNDPELDEYAKAFVMLTVMYPELDRLDPGMYGEAIDAACRFIDCGRRGDGGTRPRLFDWTADADLIIPAVNGVAHSEIRAVPYMHWWTFLGYFFEIGDCLFSTVLGIRDKRARHKKLEKWESDFCRENRAYFKASDGGISRDDEEKVLKWL